MRHFFLILMVCAILFTGVAVFAEESVLIDFSLLGKNMGTLTENRETFVDYSKVALLTSYSENDKKLMRTSLALDNWEVTLASSSRTVVTSGYSYTKETPVQQNASKPEFGGKVVLGMRVHFPVEPFNSWAIVKPPFEIPAYTDKTVVADDGTVTEPVSGDANFGKGDKFEVGFGVVKNVGVLKSVKMWVYGRNFPQSISLILKNERGEEKIINMGNLQFDGWRELIWDNPNYIFEVRNRELQIYPIYPELSPYYKLQGILVQKNAEQLGGDCIVYLKEIRLIYDKAVADLQNDILDEEVWRIITEKETERKNAEIKRLGEIQVLRYLETKKMHQETTATAVKP